MKNNLNRTVLVLCLLGFASCGGADLGERSAYASAPLEDTEANRLIEADRYLMAADMKEMMDDMTGSMSSMLPPSEVEKYEEMMDEHLNFEKLTDVMRNSVVKTFTAEEIRALADFYESPIGKSVMGKMGVYMADAMPEMMTLITEAMTEIQASDK